MRHRHHSKAVAARRAARPKKVQAAPKRRRWTLKRVILLKTAVFIGLIAAYTLPAWAAGPIAMAANAIWLYKL